MLVKSLDLKLVQRLSETRDYRDFLGVFLNGEDALLSYAEFSRRAGFKSRSYIRDILLGNKRIAPANLDRITEAMRLSANLKKYFKVLVWQSPDWKDLPTSGTLKHSQTPEQLRKLILAQARTRKKNVRSHALEILSHPDVPTLFASLGTMEEGSDLTSIAQQSRLEPGLIQKLLSKLGEAKWCEVREERYYPVATHLIFESLNDSEFFKLDFERSLKKAQKRFATQANSQQSFFFNSTLGVKVKDLPRLKRLLKQTIEEFVSSAESGEGDAVADLLIAFSSNAEGE